MALAQAANIAEKIAGHDDNAITQQDVSTFPSGGKDDTMKALVWMGKNHLVEDRDVILKVTGSTVCGSDLHLLHGAILEMKKGDILGHEFCGEAAVVGRAVHNVEVGRRYVASFQIACGECWFCERRLSSQCERTNANTLQREAYGGRTAGIFGYAHLTGGFAGGQAEYVRVPLGDVNLLEIPDGVPDEKALFLSDVLATSYHCVVDTGVEAGDSVAVWGAGPIGQMAGVFALDKGAEKLIFVDTEPRLSTMRGKFPADRLELVDYKAPSGDEKGTVVGRLKELCRGRGPDVALECAAGEYAKGWLHRLEMTVGLETDTSELVNEMIESVRSFGRCGVTGIYAGFTNHFNIGSLMQRGIRLIGNGQAPVHLYWKDLLKDIERGKLDPMQMVSHRVRLEDLDKVYHVFDEKKDGMQKVFVETKFSYPASKDSPALTRY
ncbi:S-(hydroxymethyl)glutathione dehydrogenase [Cordyceps fumosorosea ARSEF 2679]|uniref:S-(Hydroxymethyl)glutathione dehydrogenase n=1 Tax=Cordyceps fumosorosea (strain ARSEF 2679) TaxID=1081104 RepID=A0A162K3R8_CORFA|nr:S-(hydroxymethyl)glutathione dehydrogenase [Cordyceps fumosorosea ARSEF 2679]OAA52948.1 S-(hydroxymethyl)glutathione dehydrogenase [Cordyceps fumosorosea ARSEF 2679]